MDCSSNYGGIFILMSIVRGVHHIQRDINYLMGFRNNKIDCRSRSQSIVKSYNKKYK